MTAEYRNYIFDLYGTLVDIETDETEPEFWLAVSRFFSGKSASYGAEELKREYLSICASEQKMSADPLYEIELRRVFDRLYEAKGVHADEALIEDTAVFFRQSSTKKLKLYPWVRSVFSMLRESGAGVYLLSNAQACFTVYELKKLGIYNDFDGIVLSSDAGVRKPSPCIMRILLDRYGLSVHECLMTGNDQSADMAVAKAVGMDGLYIETETSGRYNKELSVERELLDGDFSKLPKLMGLLK